MKRIVAAVLLVALASSAFAETYDGPLADTVLYCVFPRNFSEAGTLKAVEDRLPGIAELGANALWLMPVHPIGEDRRKGAEGSPYAVRDFRAVHPSLGTIKDLAALTADAHARGIKVLLDLVADHSAWDNAAVKEHPDWFMKDDAGQLRPPVAAWKDVVQFDYGNPAVRTEMRSILQYWPVLCGVDGYRVDVAGMVPDTFWRESIPALRAAATGVVMLAECAGPELHEAGFDLTYDMELHDRLVQVARGEGSAADIATHLEAVRDRYPAGALLLRYTENHDNDRTAALFPAPSDRAANALIFTLPGVPLIYAGQEVGMKHRPDLFEKDPIPWKEGDPATREFYHRLIEIRRGNEALRHGSLTIVTNDRPGQVVAYTRSIGSETLLAVVNLSSARLDSATFTGVAGPTHAVNLFDGAEMSVESPSTNSISMTLAPWSFVLLSLPAGR